MKLHIFVATTQGLVAIQNIATIDDADISSIVSVNGTSTTANISNAYHSFVRKGAGIIQQDFGACSYRVNIAKRIDQGNSWQLAFYLAHAAENQQILGDGQVKAGDQVICATGEVNTTSREIYHVEEVALKQRLAAKQIAHWHKMKVKASLIVPHSNAQDLNKNLTTNNQLVNTLEQALLLLPATSTPQTSTNNRDIKQKSPYAKGNLVSLIAFIAILLSIVTIFFYQDNRSKTPLATNKSKLIHNKSAQQTWQILLLSKAPDQINENLKFANSLIEKTISEQLIAENFDVADKELLFGSQHITEQALLGFNKKQINLAIRFNLNVNQVDRISKGKWRYELSAHLVDLDSKKRIETHNEFGEFSNEVLNCEQQCLSLWFAQNARKLAQDMGAILVVKLKNLPRRYQFELNFKDFLAEELRLIHTELKRLKGFISTNLIEEFSTEKELWHQTSSRQYIYTTYLPRDDLEVELHKSFTQLGLKVTKAHSSAKTLAYVPSNSPLYFFYIFVICLLLSLIAYLTHLKRKHTKALTALSTGLHAERWLCHYDKISRWPFFRQSKWQRQKNNFITNIQLSKGLTDKAYEFIEQADYSNAQGAIDKALKLNADNIDADNLKEKMTCLPQHEKMLPSTERLSISQPEHSVKLLIDASDLNGNLDSPLVKSTFKLALLAFEEKSYYKAYSLIDKCIHHPSSIGVLNKKLSKLVEIRTNIERHIHPIKGSAVGQGALAHYYVFISATLEVGRTIADPSNSFSIGYQQVSRIGKQCIFSRKDNKFYLEDQQSTNGTFVNKTQLTPLQKVNINKGAQLILGAGEQTNQLPLCQMQLNVTSDNPPSLLMQLNPNPLQLVNSDDCKKVWPSMDIDIISHWIFLGNEISLSQNTNNIELGHNKEATNIVAYLLYQNGFYIRPERNAHKDNVLMINQEVVYDVMPIEENAVISLNGVEFSFRAVV